MDAGASDHGSSAGMLAVSRVYACQGLATRTKVFELLDSGPLSIERAPGPSVPIRWAQDNGLIRFSGSGDVHGALDLADDSLSFAAGSTHPVVKRVHECPGTVYARHRDFGADGINALDMPCSDAKSFIHDAAYTDCIAGDCEFRGFTCVGDGFSAHVYERCVGGTRQLQWTYFGDY